MLGSIFLAMDLGPRGLPRCGSEFGPPRFAKWTACAGARTGRGVTSCSPTPRPHAWPSAGSTSQASGAPSATPTPRWAPTVGPSRPDSMTCWSTPGHGRLGPRLTQPHDRAPSPDQSGRALCRSLKFESPWIPPCELGQRRAHRFRSGKAPGATTHVASTVRFRTLSGTPRGTATLPGWGGEGRCPTGPRCRSGGCTGRRLSAGSNLQTRAYERGHVPSQESHSSWNRPDTVRAGAVQRGTSCCARPVTPRSESGAPSPDGRWSRGAERSMA